MIERKLRIGVGMSSRRLVEERKVGEEPQMRLYRSIV